MQCLSVTYPGGAKNAMDSKKVSNISCVPLRFTVKILRKLIKGGLVKSYKGVNGGYAAARPLGKVSMFDIVELINGPLVISKCLNGSYECARVKRELGTDEVQDKEHKMTCYFHRIFDEINTMIADKLKTATLDNIFSADGVRMDGTKTEHI